MTTADLRIREAELEARRRRVLRGQGALVAVFAAGLGLVAAARAVAPAAFDAAVAAFLVGTAVAALVLLRRARRDWRCPACAVRWQLGDALAAAHWNHCASCGEPLRAAPRERDRERMARVRFALEALPHDTLVARFERRRRWSVVAAGAVAVAGVVTLVWIGSLGWGDMAEQAVVALFTGLAVALVVVAGRCPRCQIGILMGPGRRCPRCGLCLRRGAPPDGDAPGRTGR